MDGRIRMNYCESYYDSTAKSHLASFPPEYMGAVAEQLPPYFSAEALV